MTYVELIVVLGIFAVMSSIVIYNYGGFQAKVDMKNLASDIALKIVEAQKSSLSGNLPPSGAFLGKPSYGVHFDASDTKKFIYFANLNSDSNDVYDDGSDWGDTVYINQNAFISGVSCDGTAVDYVDIVFRRPDSRANMLKCFGGNAIITVASPRSVATATITIFPSGRIQVN